MKQYNRSDYVTIVAISLTVAILFGSVILVTRGFRKELVEAPASTVEETSEETTTETIETTTEVTETTAETTETTEIATAVAEAIAPVENVAPASERAITKLGNKVLVRAKLWSMPTVTPTPAPPYPLLEPNPAPAEPMMPMPPTPEPSPSWRHC